MKFAAIINSLVGALLLVGASTTLSAAQDGQGWRDAPWRFSFKGYGWLPEAPVTIKVDQEEVANLPESTDNILKDLEVTAMLELEAHKGPLGFFVSPVYYDGKDTEHFKGRPEKGASLPWRNPCGSLIMAWPTRSGSGVWGRLSIPPL